MNTNNDPEKRTSVYYNQILFNLSSKNDSNQRKTIQGFAKSNLPAFRKNTTQIKNKIIQFHNHFPNQIESFIDKE